MTRCNRLIIIAWSTILGVMLTLWISSAVAAIGCRARAGHQDVDLGIINGHLHLEWIRHNSTSPPVFLVEPWTQPKDRYLITRYLMVGPRPNLINRWAFGPLGQISWNRSHATQEFARIHTPIWFLTLLHTAGFALLYLLARLHYRKKTTSIP